MTVKIDPHTAEQMIRRGTNESEIKEVLETKDEIDAKYGRKKKQKYFHSITTGVVSITKRRKLK
ncbi:MAG: hypothetical protein QME52_01905 [Bacteroidota bacterium]|nr:hypothetical protein [Bacteroidota bacterium]